MVVENANVVNPHVLLKNAEILNVWGWRDKEKKMTLIISYYNKDILELHLYISNKTATSTKKICGSIFILNEASNNVIIFHQVLRKIIEKLLET